MLRWFLCAAIALAIILLAQISIAVAWALSQKSRVPEGLVASVYVAGTTYSATVCAILATLVYMAANLDGG